MMKEQIEAGLDTLRPALEADGAAIEYVAYEDGLVQLRLVFGPETCEECILDRRALEDLFATVLRETVQPLRGVSIADPRETAIGG